MEDIMRITDKIETKLRRKQKMEDTITLKGDVVVETRKHGTNIVIDREELKNLVVNVGKAHVAKLLGGVDSVDDFGYIVIGTGETGDAVDAGDTTLKTEIGREACDPVPSYVANYKVKFEKTFEFETGEEYAITEASVEDSASLTGSVMLDRFVFTEKNVDVDTDLYIKVTVTVA